MDCTDAGWVGPAAWRVDRVPGVDDVRPRSCRRCGTPARDGQRIVVQGHGAPARQVVVGAATEEARGEVGECWTRRYLCAVCSRTMTVTPQGILARHLYSLNAIVSALLLVTVEPVGDGISDLDAYGRQGMYAKPGSQEPERYRWRSLGRWARRAAQWWPDHGGTGVEALLVSFVERSGGGSRSGMIEVAVSTHVQWGGAM